MRTLVPLASFFLAVLLAQAVRGDSARRVVVYYQTIFRNEMNVSGYVDPKPLVGYATHLLVSAFHMNDVGSKIGVVTMNDLAYDNPKLGPFWNDMEGLKKKGMKVFGMLGGEAAGSYSRLSGSSFATFYPYLKEMLQKTKLQGLDLDIEQSMQLSDVVRLIQQLKNDFGSNFTITLAPVAEGLTTTGGGLSGFNYFDLEKQQGHNIGFYNTQFYDGWGPLSVQNYENVIKAGWPAEKVVAGSSGNPNDASQYVDVEKQLVSQNGIIPTLAKQYGANFGGVACWEYFDALPGGQAAPWQWAKLMHAALN